MVPYSKKKWIFRFSAWVINQMEGYGKHIIPFFLLVLLIAVAQPVFGTTYYIGSSGNDSNAGTQLQPWLTLSKALNTATAGDTVNVGSGTYPGSATTVSSGYSGKPITIKGPPDMSAIITGRLTIKHSHYVITGFHFNGVDLQMVGTGANYNTIDANKFSQHIQGIYMQIGNANGDGVNGPSYNTISNNEFTNPLGNGSVVTLGTSNLIASNTFHDLGGWDALRIWGVGTVIRGNTFKNNISGTEAGISNHADLIQSFESSTGVWAKNVIFEQNKIIDCTCQFGNLEAGKGNISNWTFRNNLFIRSRLQINIYVPYVSFYNNTAFGNDSTLGFRFAYSTDKGAANNGQVINNIFVRCNGYYSFNTELSGSKKDFNLVTNLNDGIVENFSEDNGVNKGFTPSQVFVRSDENDFSLVSGSPAINKGLPISNLLTDINGKDRTIKATFDIGAYMYPQSGLTTVPAAPAGLIVSPQ